MRNLTTAELNHLLGLLWAEDARGDYSGNRQQYEARTKRLIEWCERALVAGGSR